MKRIDIPSDQFTSEVFPLWRRRNLLLCAGDFASGRYNMMTVGWGSFGVIWAEPFVMVLVRKSRYTFQFMEQYPDFTLSAFPEENQKILDFCGTKSGRDFPDKAKAAGLTPECSSRSAAPSFAEADLVIECRSVYRSSIAPEGFLNQEDARKYYPNGDFHKIYFGTILHITGIESYLK